MLQARGATYELLWQQTINVPFFSVRRFDAVSSLLLLPRDPSTPVVRYVRLFHDTSGLWDVQYFVCHDSRGQVLVPIGGSYIQNGEPQQQRYWNWMHALTDDDLTVGSVKSASGVTIFTLDYGEHIAAHSITLKVAQRTGVEVVGGKVQLVSLQQQVTWSETIGTRTGRCSGTSTVLRSRSPTDTYEFTV